MFVCSQVDLGPLANYNGDAKHPGHKQLQDPANYAGKCVCVCARVCACVCVHAQFHACCVKCVYACVPMLSGNALWM